MSELKPQLPTEIAQFDNLEAMVAKDGSRRVYGVDNEGHKQQIAGDDVLAAYGYSPDEARTASNEAAQIADAPQPDAIQKKSRLDSWADKLQSEREAKEQKQSDKLRHKTDRSYVRDEAIKARDKAGSLRAKLNNGGELSAEQTEELAEAERLHKEGREYLKNTTRRALGRAARRASQAKPEASSDAKKKSWIDRKADKWGAERIAKEQKAAEKADQPNVPKKPLIDRYADRVTAQKKAKEQKVADANLAKADAALIPKKSWIDRKADKWTAERIAKEQKAAEKADNSVGTENQPKSRTQRLKDRWNSLRTRVAMATVGDFKGALEGDREKEHRISRKLFVGATALALAGVAAVLIKRGDIDLLPTKGRFGDGDGIGIDLFGIELGNGTNSHATDVGPGHPTGGEVLIPNAKGSGTESSEAVKAWVDQVKPGDGITHSIMDYAAKSGKPISAERAFEIFNELKPSITGNSISGSGPMNVIGDIGYTTPGQSTWSPEMVSRMNELLGL